MQHVHATLVTDQPIRARLAGPGSMIPAVEFGPENGPDFSVYLAEHDMTTEQQAAWCRDAAEKLRDLAIQIEREHAAAQVERAASA